MSKNMRGIKRGSQQDLDIIAKNIAKFKSDIKQGISLVSLGALLTGSAGATPAVLFGSALIGKIVDFIFVSGGVITFIAGLIGLYRYKRKIKNEVSEYLEEFKSLFEKDLIENTEAIKELIKDKVFKPFEAAIFDIKKEKGRYENLEKELEDIYQKIRKLESEVLYSS